MAVPDRSAEVASFARIDFHLARFVDRVNIALGMKDRDRVLREIERLHAVLVEGISESEEIRRFVCSQPTA